MKKTNKKWTPSVHAVPVLGRRGRAYRAFAVSIVLTLGAPWALASQLDALATEQVSVRELMRLETEYALQLARERRRHEHLPAVGARPQKAMHGEPALRAIYGIGQRLMAEVAVGGHVYLYRRGEALPLGVAAGPEVLLLRGIEASCIQLSRDDVEHRLCLSPSKWTSK